MLGNVETIDLRERCVTLRHPLETMTREIRYDHLVIALGSDTSTFGIPGVAERALPFKSLDDAEILRNEVISNLELAHVTSDEGKRRRLLTFAIAGGGFTGVEVAGELEEFLRSVRAFYGATVDLAKISIVEGGPRLLPELPEGVGDYARRNLAARGVDVRLQCTVTRASEARRSRCKAGAIIRRPRNTQFAEAELLAKNITAICRGEATQPFRFTTLGSMASLGARRGVALLPGGVLVTGFLAWFLWRSYYLSRLPGWDRRARVAFDWTAGLIFPRYIAHLRVYTEHAHESRVLPVTIRLRRLCSNQRRCCKQLLG